MRKYDKITPDGTKDYLFKECKIRRKAESKLRELYENFGYDEVMTTSLEFYDVFSEGVGRVSQNELYTLNDGSGRLITIRPDSTKPIARLYASRLKDFVLPIKLYYTQPVFKRNLRFNRKPDEILQMGVELIGAKGKRSDMEVLILAIKSMKLLFGNDFYLEIGHMGVINAVLDSIGAFKEEARSAISRKNFPEVDELVSKIGPKGKILGDISRLFGGPKTLKEAKDKLKGALEQKAIIELQGLYSILEKENLQENILFDFSIVNEYQYYTGLVFRCFVKGIGAEVMSGGRYDTLYGDYGLDIPAIGFAINLNEALEYLLDREETQYPLTAVLYSEKSSVLADKDPIMAKYKEKGYRCLFSVCESLEETKKWANAIKANILIIDKDNNTIEEIIIN